MSHGGHGGGRGAGSGLRLPGDSTGSLKAGSFGASLSLFGGCQPKSLQRLPRSHLLVRLDKRRGVGYDRCKEIIDGIV
jgi:hypothetical protein